MQAFDLVNREIFRAENRKIRLHYREEEGQEQAKAHGKRYLV